MRKNTKISIFVFFGVILVLAIAYAICRNQYSASTISSGPEICDNGVDDDGNGTIDGCWDPGKAAYHPSRTLHVNITGGNDNGSGVSSSPFKTINKAASVAQAGDMISVAAGTYVEDVVFANAGTPENPIILIAADKNKRPVVSNTTPPSSSFRGIRPRGNTVIDSIVIDGVKTVTSAGHNLGGMGIKMDQDTIENVLVTNCVIKNTTEALRATNGKRLIVRDTQAYGNEDGFLISAKGEDLFVDTLFERVESADSPFRDSNNDGFVIEGRYGHHVFRNCSAHGFVDAGLDIKSNNVLVDGFVTYNNDTGMKIWRSATVQNSIAYKNRSVNFDMGAEGESGIYWKFVNNINLDGVVKIEKGQYYDGNGNKLPGTGVTPQTVKISHNIFYNTDFNIDDRFTETTKKFLEAGDHNLYYASDYTTVPEATSIIAKPSFVNYTGSITVAQDFHLTAGSAGVDKGSTSYLPYSPRTDKDGKIRFQDSAIDIGAYEYPGTINGGGGTDDGEEGREEEEEDNTDSDEGAINHPPVINPINNITSTGEVKFSVQASDQDGDDIVFSAENLPEGAEFDTRTGSFRWLSALSQRSVTGTSYEISFTATDSHGATGSIKVMITLKLFASANQRVSVATTTRQCVAPCTIDFTVSARIGGAITNYLWSFGDGGKASGQSVSHLYTKPGTYNVTIDIYTKIRTHVRSNFYVKILGAQSY